MRWHHSTKLRRGMWAVDKDGRIGIVNQLLVADEDKFRLATAEDKNVTHVDFHVVDEAGDTLIEAVMAEGQVTQASAEQIPEARRPRPQLIKYLGY